MGCPQIKICGLTNVQQAVQCAELGADAIGLVFYAKSPRNVTDPKARQICMALPPHVDKVGVFVDETFEHIMQRVERCSLTAVQLHGQESPELVGQLRLQNLTVIKALFMGKNPGLKQAADYEASAFLLEWGPGKLPGGNALTWDYGKALNFGREHPFLLAGGLSPENVFQAVGRSEPDGVDVSSGVESTPGQKDLKSVKTFITAVSRCQMLKKPRRIFQ